MTGASLLSRYDWNVGWDAEALLDIMVALLVQQGDIDKVVKHLDAIAEQELETYAGMNREA